MQVTKKPCSTLHTRPDVLIVGGSIAGSVLATLLRKKGLSVVLAERNAEPRKIFKGEYLQPAVVDFLHAIGMRSVFRSKSVAKVRELRFRDLDAKNKVTADLLMKYPRGKSARSIHHFDLLNNLFRINRARLGVNFWSGCTVTPLNAQGANFLRAPEFRLEAPGREPLTIRPRWVVGCDGRSSSVRKWMGIEEGGERDQMVTLGAGREFIMGMELKDFAPKADRYEVIRTAGHGTIAAFSLGEDGQRIYFSSPARENLAKAASKDIREILDATEPMAHIGHAPEDAVAVGSPANTSSFRGCAKGRFLLAGDAVAVTTPYGGQGMTLAVEQAKYLGQVFDWSADSALSLTLTKRNFTRFAKRGYDRVNLLNFGLYYLFFTRQAFYKHSTRYMVETWNQRPELAARVMRLFAGLDTDKPSVRELIDLWGINRVGPMIENALVLLKRSAGDLLFDRLNT